MYVVWGGGGGGGGCVEGGGIYVVSVTVKRLALPTCAVDGDSRNRLYFYLFIINYNMSRIVTSVKPTQESRRVVLRPSCLGCLSGGKLARRKYFRYPLALLSVLQAPIPIQPFSF